MSTNRSARNHQQKQNEEFEVVLTHEHADFDAIASLLAASLLYPQALPVLPHWVNRNVRDFLDEHQHLISFVHAGDLPRGRVTRAILVDTLRVNQVKGMNEATPHLVIDHHTRQAAPPEEWELWSEPVGANVTLLIEKLIAKQIELTTAQATLMALAIHEDTGSLTYATTTPRDARCLTWLLEQGAELEVVLHFVNHPLSHAQRELLALLIEQCEFIERSGYAIAIAQATIDDFHDEFSTLVAHLRDSYDLDATFLLIERNDIVHLVARSTKDAFDVGAIARAFGGDGHRRASAAPVHDRSRQNVRDQIVALLEEQLEAAHQEAAHQEAARQQMHDTAQPLQQPLHEERLLEQALPAEHLHLLRLLGEVAQELDQQIFVVGGFVRDLLYGTVDEPVGVQRSTADLDIVVESSEAAKGTDTEELQRHPPANAIAFAEEIVQRFGGRMVPHKRFGTAKWLLQDPDNPVDVDALLRHTSSRPMTTPSNAKAGEEAVARPDNRRPLRMERLPRHLDFVSARTEFYSAPTELPTVAHGDIELDLRRRDFTINTLALALTPARWGELLDYFGGVRDLQQGIVRVLHSRSFVDDPTRMVRAVRYEQRFGFHIETQTEALLLDARSLLHRLSPARLRHELERIFCEREPEGALSRLKELGLMEMIHPALDVTMQVRHNFSRLRKALSRADQLGHIAAVGDLLRATPIERLYWVLWIAPLAPEVDEELITRLALRGETQRLMQGMRRLQRHMDKLVDPDLSVSSIVAILDRVDPVAIALLHATSPRRALVQTLERYLTEWRQIVSLLNGHDLEKLGVPRGPLFSTLLAGLRMARLDGEIDSREDEVRYVEQRLGKKD